MNAPETFAISYQNFLRTKLGWPRMYFLSQEQLGAMPADERAAVEAEYQQYRDHSAEEREWRQLNRKLLGMSDAQFDVDNYREERGLAPLDAKQEDM